ncbi:MAG: hypothetical protein RIS79_1586 [Verrucomicrobiota bacterium]
MKLTYQIAIALAFFKLAFAEAESHYERLQDAKEDTEQQIKDIEQDTKDYNDAIREAESYGTEPMIDDPEEGLLTGYEVADKLEEEQEQYLEDQEERLEDLGEQLDAINESIETYERENFI